MTGVVGQNFRDSIPDLGRNIELVTLKKDVDIGVSLESLLQAKEDREELNKLFTSLEFKTWIKSSSDSSDEKLKVTNIKISQFGLIHTNADSAINGKSPK